MFCDEEPRHSVLCIIFVLLSDPVSLGGSSLSPIYGYSGGKIVLSTRASIPTSNVQDTYTGKDPVIVLSHITSTEREDSVLIISSARAISRAESRQLTNY